MPLPVFCREVTTAREPSAENCTGWMLPASAVVEPTDSPVVVSMKETYEVTGESGIHPLRADEVTMAILPSPTDWTLGSVLPATALVLITEPLPVSMSVSIVDDPCGDVMNARWPLPTS
ncbi:hypothetical protein [Mycobacterium sp. ST-F2]|uniref:hypothetical protein n=1 Tax=Mycobacterium sp. ST-F2 TaxID=1490484 RepID=UPI0011513C0A|nr:hypothetical protein [Mycobacterium sp. ST-F2]